MVLARQFTTDDKAVRFDFDFTRDPNGELVMDVAIHWSHRPEDCFRLGRRSAGGRLVFDHIFPTGDRIHGELRGVSFNDQDLDDDVGIWGDFFYRYRNMDLGHFEGVMVSFPRDGRETTKVSVETPTTTTIDAAPSPSRAATSEPQSEPETPLFSYLYLHGWPALLPRDQQAYLMVYRAEQAPADNLYHQLLALVARGAARADFSAAATAYIEAAETSGFVTDPTQLGALTRLAEALAANPELNREQAQAMLGQTDLATYCASPAYLKVLDQVWQSLFALAVLAGYRTDLAAALTGILRATALLEAQQDLPLQHRLRLARARAVLPSTIFPLPPIPGTQGSSPTISTFAIGDLVQVHERPLRYEPGEVARIVNVMRGERKKVLRRQRRRLIERDRQVDHHSRRTHKSDSERQHHLRGEVQTTMGQHALEHAYKGFDSSYGPPATVKLEGTYTATTLPLAPSREDRSRFARQVLGRSADRLADRVRHERATSKLEETEELESSIIDNIQGQTHLSGVYRWLDRIHLASLSSCGSRLMLAVTLTAPGADLRDERGRRLEAPIPPHALGLTSFKDLTEQTYLDLAARYGVRDLLESEPTTRLIGATLQSELEKTITLPRGYQAKSARVTCVLAQNASPLSGIVGSSAFSFSASGSQSLTLADEDAELPIILSRGSTTAPAPAETVNQLPDQAVSVEISCSLGERANRQWQVRAHAQLVEAYQRARQAFIRRLLGTTGHDGDHWRGFETRQIRRACLALLAASYQAPSSDADRDPLELLKLQLEQLFEWDRLSYSLSQAAEPNLDASADDWTHEDAPLSALLSASQARVMLPVKPSANAGALYYLRAGTLWLGADADTPVHEADTALLCALEHMPPGSRRSLGPSWELRIPTTLQILDQSALPTALSDPSPQQHLEDEAETVSTLLDQPDESLQLDAAGGTP